jgi:hypothetical protein
MDHFSNSIRCPNARHKMAETNSCAEHDKQHTCAANKAKPHASMLTTNSIAVNVSMVIDMIMQLEQIQHAITVAIQIMIFFIAMKENEAFLANIVEEQIIHQICANTELDM